MKLGWISLHRQLQNNWVWKEKPFSKGQAWVDILLECNHAENKILIKGKLLTVERGESLNSLKTWAKKWGWTIGKVRRFFELLQKDSMIELKNESISTRLTVCNYDNYQNEQHAHETQTKRTRHGDDTHTDTNNNVNNENNENNERVEDLLPPTPNEVRNIWLAIYGDNPKLVELDFINELVGKYGLERAKRIVYKFKHKNFHSISTMKEALKDDGTIREKNTKKELTGYDAF